MSSPIRRIERDVLGDLALPAIAVRKQALLVEIELLARLRGELEVRSFHDGVDRNGLRRTDGLAELAGDAAFLAVGVAAQRVLAAKTRRNRPLLEGIVER